MAAIDGDDNVAIADGAKWRELVHDAFGSVDLTIADDAQFFAQIQRSRLGSFEMAAVTSARELSRRTKNHIARHGHDYFVFSLVRSGTLRVVQVGRECCVMPGMFVLLDMNSPYVWQHDERVQVLDVKIPSSVIISRFRDPHAAAAVGRAARSGVGRVAADMLLSLSRESRSIPEDHADVFSEQLLDVLAILFEQDREGDLPAFDSSMRSAIYGRAVRIIDANLSDIALSPAIIARKLGISVRYLHRVFQDTGSSVGEYVREARLKRCHDDLLSEPKAALKIGQIAARGGFQSQSHFSAVFKKRYGVVPSALRRGGAAQV